VKTHYRECSFKVISTNRNSEFYLSMAVSLKQLHSIGLCRPNSFTLSSLRSSQLTYWSPALITLTMNSMGRHGRGFSK